MYLEAELLISSKLILKLKIATAIAAFDAARKALKRGTRLQEIPIYPPCGVIDSHQPEF